MGLANVSEEALEALEFAPCLFVYPTEKYPPWSVLHGVRCPRRSRARVPGGGARKRSLDGKVGFPPLLRVLCKAARPPAQIIVVY